jgi:hypothetical protein
LFTTTILLLTSLIFSLSTNDPDIDPFHVIANNTSLIIDLLAAVFAISAGLIGLARWNKSLQTARYDQMQKVFTEKIDNSNKVLSDKLDENTKNLCDKITQNEDKTHIVLDEQNKRFDKIDIMFDKIDAKIDTSKEILIKDSMILQEHDKRLSKVETKLDK